MRRLQSLRLALPDDRASTCGRYSTLQTSHNLVVCTLCSCYPWTVLGIPPSWYKAPPYRARAVIDPRGVLAEFGVTLPETTKIRVWDSTAETRYLVVPMRPEGTDGMDVDGLAALVTRNAMIGTHVLDSPVTASQADGAATVPATGRP